MTIRMRGHIQGLHTAFRAGWEEITLVVERERMKEDTITVFAKKGEAEMYRPGMMVEVAITPIPAPPPPEDR